MVHLIPRSECCFVFFVNVWFSLVVVSSNSWSLPLTGDDSGPLGNLGSLVDTRAAKVRCQNIWDVIRGDEFHINNLLDDEYEPRERHIIVRDARHLVGRTMEYCVLTHNCEHFVTALRYGQPESRQVGVSLPSDSF